uniref:Polymerase (DNA-directed), epsilon 4, accessory subunit n=1 Tax=Cyprinus carpio carpio TaxID=630221 RepID=A0A9J7XDV6_CYPCA
MAATAPVAPAESELDRSGAEDEPRSAEPEEDAGNGQTGPTAGAQQQQHRLAKLPLSRIKALMKADPDVSLASQESVFIIAKATLDNTILMTNQQILQQQYRMDHRTPNSYVFKA